MGSEEKKPRERPAAGGREGCTGPRRGPGHSVRGAGVAGPSVTHKRADDPLKRRRGEGGCHRDRQRSGPALTPLRDVPTNSSVTASLEGLQRDVSRHHGFTRGKSAPFQVVVLCSSPALQPLIAPARTSSNSSSHGFWSSAL